MRRLSLIIVALLLTFTINAQIADRYVGGSIKTSDGVRELKFPPLSSKIYKKGWIDFNKIGHGLSYTR